MRPASLAFSPPGPANGQVQVRQAGHGHVLVIPIPPAAQAPADQTPPTPVGTYTPLQKGVMISAVVWGCVGTALFFSRRQQGLKQYCSVNS